MPGERKRGYSEEVKWMGRSERLTCNMLSFGDHSQASTNDVTCASRAACVVTTPEIRY